MHHKALYHHNCDSFRLYIKPVRKALYCCRLQVQSAMTELLLHFESWQHICHENRAAKPLEDAIAREKQFITDASHDLKTPLTVILSNADILSRNQDCCDSGMSKWIDGTKQAALSMKELIEQMLVLSESESKTEVKKEDINISDIAEKCTLVMESAAYEKNIEYKAEI